MGLRQRSENPRAADLDDHEIDLLINNAGILPRMNSLAEVDFDDYNRVLAVNTVGPGRVTRSLAADLGPEGFVCIVIHPGWVRTDMGGANAPVLPEDSAAGIRRVFGGLSPGDNGTYWTYEGETLP